MALVVSSQAMPVFVLKVKLTDTENIGTLTVPKDKPWVIDVSQIFEGLPD